MALPASQIIQKQRASICTGTLSLVRVRLRAEVGYPYTGVYNRSDPVDYGAGGK